MRLILAILALATANAASALDLKGHMIEAIKHGSSEGELDGNAATMMMAKTGSSSTPHVNVTQVGNFARPDCKRLVIKIMQENVPTKEGIKVPVNFPPFEMSMCSDGSPPDPRTAISEFVMSPADKSGGLLGDIRVKNH